MKRRFIPGLVLAAAFTLTNCSEQLVTPEKGPINVDGNIENITPPEEEVDIPFEVFANLGESPETKTYKAKLEIINSMRYDYPFGNDLKIMFIVSIGYTSITHIHSIPQFIINVFRDVSCEHRQGIAKMFASVIVKEMILDKYFDIYKSYKVLDKNKEKFDNRNYDIIFHFQFSIFNFLCIFALANGMLAIH